MCNDLIHARLIVLIATAVAQKPCRKCHTAASLVIFVRAKMGSPSALLLSWIVLIACTSAQQVLLQGRFGGNVSEQTGMGSLPLIFSWPASSIYATFESTSINVTLSALEPAVDSAQYTRFVFFLDQQQVALKATDPNAPVINWSASDLSNGIHNLTITKISEASYGQATLNVLNLAPGGR